MCRPVGACPVSPDGSAPIRGPRARDAGVPSTPQTIKPLSDENAGDPSRQLDEQVGKPAVALGRDQLGQFENAGAAQHESDDESSPPRIGQPEKQAGQRERGHAFKARWRNLRPQPGRRQCGENDKGETEPGCYGEDLAQHASQPALNFKNNIAIPHKVYVAPALRGKSQCRALAVSRKMIWSACVEFQRRPQLPERTMARAAAGLRAGGTGGSIRRRWRLP